MPPSARLFVRGSRDEVGRLADVLRKETVGGILLLAAAVVALVWANWWDVLGLAMLGGGGFTVSPLIGELAFGVGSPLTDFATVGVLTGSTIAAILAALVLTLRNRRYGSRTGPAE